MNVPLIGVFKKQNRPVRTFTHGVNLANPGEILPENWLVAPIFGKTIPSKKLGVHVKVPCENTFFEDFYCGSRVVDHIWFLLFGR